jgi:hypothetical protein
VEAAVPSFSSFFGVGFGHFELRHFFELHLFPNFVLKKFPREENEV